MEITMSIMLANERNINLLVLQKILLDKGYSITVEVLEGTKELWRNAVFTCKNMVLFKISRKKKTAMDVKEIKKIKNKKIDKIAEKANDIYEIKLDTNSEDAMVAADLVKEEISRQVLQ